jgi:hypothetical protein
VREVRLRFQADAEKAGCLGHPAFCFSKFGELGLRGSCDERLEAGVQPALVTRNGVLVKDALLHALVEGGDGGLELGLGDLDVASGEGFAHQAEAAANAGTVGAVHFSFYNGLTGAL